MSAAKSGFSTLLAIVMSCVPGGHGQEWLGLATLIEISGTSAEKQKASEAKSQELMEEVTAVPILPAQNAEDSSSRNGGGAPQAPVTPSLKIMRFANYRFSHRDGNRDGRLSPEEWPEGKEIWETVDRDRNGTVSLEEYGQWLARFAAGRRIRLRLPLLAEGEMSSRGIYPDQLPQDQFIRGSSPRPGGILAGEGRSPLVPPLSGSGAQTRSAETPRRPKYFVAPEQLPVGLPSWFFGADRDGDGQITLAEFIADGGPERVTEFQRWDHNGDGVITPEEVLAGARPGTPAQKASGSSEPTPATEEVEPDSFSPAADNR
jgi:Ca2+-binding EF-hand superfamily protein